MRSEVVSRLFVYGMTSPEAGSLKSFRSELRQPKFYTTFPYDFDIDNNRTFALIAHFCKMGIE